MWVFLSVVLFICEPILSVLNVCGCNCVCYLGNILGCSYIDDDIILVLGQV